MGDERFVLNFHGIGKPHHGVERDEEPYWCDTEMFYHLLDYLPKFSDIKTEITFDDGNMSDFEIAMPALQERGLTGTFFVTAGRLNNPEYLGSKEIEALEQAGMSIGCHGWSHIDLRSVDQPTLTQETINAVELLNGLTKAPINSFAIPFGSYNRRVLEALKGFRTIYTSDGYRASGLGRIVPRISYVRQWTVGTMEELAREKYSFSQTTRQRLVLTLKRFR